MQREAVVRGDEVDARVGVPAFDLLRPDPVLNRVKLIAEPWDLAAGGDPVGNFPAGWAEWNDRHRYTAPAADPAAGYWEASVDTAHDSGIPPQGHQRAESASAVEGRSFVLLRHVRETR